MRYVGIDVHQRMSAVCILDKYGKKEQQFIFRGAWTKVIEAFVGFGVLSQSATRPPAAMDFYTGPLAR